jgi:hypothetical protein
MGTITSQPQQPLVLPNQKGWVSTDFIEYGPDKQTVLAKYKTLDRLGKGGFGTVFKVHFYFLFIISFPFYH